MVSFGFLLQCETRKGLGFGSVVLRAQFNLNVVYAIFRFVFVIHAQIQEEIKLEPMDTASLPFETARHRESAGEFDLRGKAALVKWGEGGVKDTRENLPPLQVDRPGTFVYPLVRRFCFYFRTCITFRF